MFWSKKKKQESGLPDLPPVPNTVPSISDYQHPSPAEPAFPHQEFPNNQSFQNHDTQTQKAPAKPIIPQSQNIDSEIKNAVNDSTHPLPPSNNQDGGYKIIEMEEWSPEKETSHLPPLPRQNPPKIPKQEIDHDPDLEQPMPLPRELPRHHDFGTIQQHYHDPGEPQTLHEPKQLFVKIDKFKAARESLENVQLKLTEIEELLKMIREVKQKEDREITEWEREMETIKARIAHVTTEVFDNSFKQ